MSQYRTRLDQRHDARACCGKVDVVVTTPTVSRRTLAQAISRYAVPAPTISQHRSATARPTADGSHDHRDRLRERRDGEDRCACCDRCSRQRRRRCTARTPLGLATAQLSTDVVVTNPDSTKATASGAFTVHRFRRWRWISVRRTRSADGTSGAGRRCRDDLCAVYADHAQRRKACT